MELSKRLSAVARLVTKGNRLADVGTDHGYIPIYLVKKGWVPSAIAMDVNPGPLKRASENIALYDASQYIQTRLSDGIEALLPGEVDTVVMAGMGGNLIQKLLSQGENVGKSIKEWVLQPQSDASALRHYLQVHGYRILQEDIVLEEGKYYPMMQVAWGQMEEWSKLHYQFGLYLLEERHPVLQSFLLKKREELSRVYEHICGLTTQDGMLRAKEMRQEIAQVNEALRLYEM